MAIELEQPVIDDGDRFVNFFEGRILTGRDLRDEQQAARRRRLALGRALGAGVAFGLEVRDATSAGGAPTLGVSAGLAINREGETLRLETDRKVRLSRAKPSGGAAKEAIFGPCDVTPEGAELPAQEGLYLLTIAPASDYEQEAPKSGIGEGGTAGGCGRRYATLGVQFRLVRFDPATLAADGGAAISDLVGATGAKERSLLRNLVAHLGLGTAARAVFPADPFAQATDDGSQFARYGLADSLSHGPEAPLTDCEVPLAVLHWRQSGIGFVDMWTVRRRLAPPPQEPAWPLLASARRATADEATFFQFQRHLAWLLPQVADPGGVEAPQAFRYLPPAGLLPLPSAATFLGSDQEPLPLAPARLIPLLEEALPYAAVDLQASPAPGFLIYRVGDAKDYLLFVSDAVPSPELAAEKCAALKERLERLEQALEAPGILRGLVQVTNNFAALSSTKGISGVTVRATNVEDESISGETITDEDGHYKLSLPPGTYTVKVVELEAFGMEEARVEVQRGGETVKNLRLQLSAR